MRNFLNPSRDDSDMLELTLTPSDAPAPPSGKYPKPPLWHIYYQPPRGRRGSSTTPVEVRAGSPAPAPATLEAPGRGTFPLALCVHVVARGPEAADRAAGIAREAWVRSHRLNRLGSQAVPHWFGLYAGLGEADRHPVAVYAGLVAAGGAAAQRWVSTPAFSGEWVAAPSRRKPTQADAS